MKTKKFLYHHRTQGEGAEGVHIRGMIDGFRKCGYTADIIGPPGVDPYATRNGSESSEKKPGWVKRLWAGVGEKAPQVLFVVLEILYNLFALPRLLRKVRGDEYAFFYERYALNTFVGVLFAKWAGLPILLEVNDATVIERSRPLVLKGLAQFVERRVFAQADLIITITEQFKGLILSNYSLSEAKILVLPNAIDPDRFTLVPEKRFLRTDLGIEEKQLVIGCLGAFVPWHRIDLLISSAAKIAEKYDLFFLFIGDGPVRPATEKLAHELGIENRIRFTGFMSPGTVPYYLDHVDICVIPGSNEHGSPMKLFEYMAMGKAIVLPRFKPLEQILIADVEGAFFTPGDIKSFKTVLSRVVTDKAARSSMAIKAYEKVMGCYTWEINAQRALKASLVGNGGAFESDDVGTVFARGRV